jgi:hypothetical protein
VHNGMQTDWPGCCAVVLSKMTWFSSCVSYTAAGSGLWWLGYHQA